MKRNIFFILLFTILFLSCKSAVSASPFLEEKEKYIIVIDPGHGGENLGTISNETFTEKEITMKTALALVEELSKYDGVEVYLTHEQDVDLSLKQRAEYAQKVGADFLFSLHYNASEYHTMFGTEVWIPLEAPYHTLGYQFAYLQQLEMQEIGLFSRGIKTRANDAGTDYYGIIRESVALDIPAVIIEHCYVDEDRDGSYVDSDEDFAEFGTRDAYAIAQFLGLEAYEGPEELLSVSETEIFTDTYADSTIPDVCEISTEKVDYENGTVTITVNALDYDSPLMYYDYSLDGGETYSKLYAWPESDMLEGTYDGTFSLMLSLAENTNPCIIVRAYNKFDLFLPSNAISDFSAFPDSEELPEANTSESEQEILEYQFVNATDNLEENTPMTPQRILLLIGFIIFWVILLVLMVHVVYTFFGFQKHRHRK